jgi:hypothetical protein
MQYALLSSRPDGREIEMIDVKDSIVTFLYWNGTNLSFVLWYVKQRQLEHAIALQNRCILENLSV